MTLAESREYAIMSLSQMEDADMEKQYCVVYRTGGTANFQWHRTIPGDRDETAALLDDVILGGRKAYLVPYLFSMSIGLPETFDASDPIRIYAS
jgi:hypothetical protein